MKRGSIKRADSVLVGVWVPRPLLDAMDQIIESEDSDRSKFARRAIRNRIAQSGVTVPAETKEAQ